MKSIHIIVGCGYYGRAIFRKIKKKNVIFIDNNLNIKSCLNKKVLNPLWLSKNKSLIKKIYLAGRYLDEQVPQLKKLKMYQNIKIFKNYELLPSKKNILLREKKILRILKLLFHKFEINKINYWIDRSSLLAIYRKQFFSEFSDVDISIDIRDYKKFSYILKKLSNKLNVEYKNIMIEKKKFKKYFITSSKKNIKLIEPALIDFIYRKFEKKKIISKGIKLKDIPLGFLTNRQICNYSGLKFYIPQDSKKYLKFIYGLKWKKKINYYLKSKRI